ncbi:DUF4136 domain-containing protein [Hydrogenovibrio sp. 3SP14C1]|uniref:DUF4136 domain-containing protein n=1 Tax=Hydrogenovibrio sp. 3SP14C1 TaxID=3038774 RepID=UPI002415D9DC|nr:DUF4136 domain-containing protein [Hydrogenovibrio sp. 3SP14C1]MDG4812173.1 DUF4136 domain-containing protein [Hydrogenovibrio sp. 3SP14C1]
MKKQIINVVWILSILTLLSGCSGIQVSQDYDDKANFGSIKTLQWVPNDKQIDPKASDFAEKNPLIAKRVENAITNEMQAKDYKFVTQNPDAFITYHIGTKSKIRSQPVSTSIGFGTFGGGSFGGIGFQTSPDVEQYEEGRLVVDILDTNQKLLWRGTSTTYLEDHLSSEETTELVNKVVKKLLAQYPPGAQK